MWNSDPYRYLPRLTFGEWIEEAAGVVLVLACGVVFPLLVWLLVAPGWH